MHQIMISLLLVRDLVLVSISQLSYLNRQRDKAHNRRQHLGRKFYQKENYKLVGVLVTVLILRSLLHFDFILFMKINYCCRFTNSTLSQAMSASIKSFCNGLCTCILDLPKKELQLGWRAFEVKVLIIVHYEFLYLLLFCDMFVIFSIYLKGYGPVLPEKLLRIYCFFVASFIKNKKGRQQCWQGSRKLTNF